MDTAPMPTTPAGEASWRSTLAGARAMLPWLVAVCPFGVVIGMTVAQSSLPPALGVATGVAIFSGSAQLATVELLARDSAPVTVVVTALAINARLLAYSGAIALHWRGTSRGFRAAAAYFLVDPTFSVGMDGYERPGTPRRAAHLSYLGAAVLLWVLWQAAIVTGLIVGSGLPDWLHPEFVVPLFLLAQVVRHTRDSSGARAAAISAALAAMAGDGLPLRSGLLVAIVAGVAAGLAVDARAGARVGR